MNYKYVFQDNFLIISPLGNHKMSDLHSLCTKFANDHNWEYKDVLIFLNGKFGSLTNNPFKQNVNISIDEREWIAATIEI